MTKHFLIQRYYCELLWAFQNLRYRFSTLLRSRQSVTGRREELENTRRVLRHILREYPYWQLGHARLGMTEIELAQLSDLPLPPRSRATIRCSVDAIRALEPECGKFGRASSESVLLEACVDYDDRNFKGAYEKVQTILEPSRFTQLTDVGSARALQIAGRCAAVLEGEATAKKFYDRIPKVSKLH